MLQPGAIYGTRYMPGSRLPIPLWLAMAPAAALLRRAPAALAAHSPVSVQRVAAAAVDAATRAEYRGKATVVDNARIIGPAA